MFPVTDSRHRKDRHRPHERSTMRLQSERHHPSPRSRGKTRRMKTQVYKATTHAGHSRKRAPRNRTRPGDLPACATSARVASYLNARIPTLMKLRHHLALAFSIAMPLSALAEPVWI